MNNFREHWLKKENVENLVGEHELSDCLWTFQCLYKHCKDTKKNLFKVDQQQQNMLFIFLNTSSFESATDKHNLRMWQIEKAIYTSFL